MKIKHIAGEARYYLAIVRGVIKLKAWQMSIDWDDGAYHGPTYLLSVCNGPRTGGMMIAPGAMMDDGRFDIVLVPKVPKRAVINFCSNSPRANTSTSQPSPLPVPLPSKSAVNRVRRSTPTGKSFQKRPKKSATPSCPKN
ncbi:MAG: hypothetical protein M5U34_21590 [Chloroflexi bacterium]|nr:hypothetical protein [Chloroflexota bacterium]